MATTPPTAARWPSDLPLQEAKGFAPATVLQGVARALDSRRSPRAPPVLADVRHAQPVLGPCHLLDVSQLGGDFPFVISQARTNGGYVYVKGRRDGVTKGEKTPRSKQAWPRDRAGRKRLVDLHVWLLTATRGPRPKRTDEAAHRCGRSACVLAAHLHWATPAENCAEREWHRSLKSGSRPVTRAAARTPMKSAV